MSLFAALLFCAMSSAEAVTVVLNTVNSTDVGIYEEARRIVESEAAAGKPLQQYVIGVTTDDVELARRYKDAARGTIRRFAEERDNPLAWYLLSVETNDVSLLRRAAEGGNVQAHNALGSLDLTEAYNNKSLPSNEVVRLLKSSREHFKQAALQRDANGFVNLGTCYLQGIGCQKNAELAYECFRHAAEQGHPEGMESLAAVYQLGHGVKQDDEKSLYWDMRARAARGSEAAATWLKERK